jgi:multidrug efflux pump subunit AcrB
VTILTRAALSRPLTVYVLMAIVVLMGISAYSSLPRESYPEIKVPLILVSTVYTGASPSDVEGQVTRKIETEVKAISGIKEIRSTSYDGYSLIEVEFNPDVNLDTALQKVREKVDLAKPDLPDDVEDPSISDVDFSRIPILIVNLAGEFGMARLKSIADDLKDDLEAIPGVNLINIVGGQDREVQVFADPRRLTAFELGLSDLVETIQREHLNMPGGDVDVGRQSFLVRLTSEVEDPKEILDFVVATKEGRPVYVRDVATVVYGFVEAETRSRMNGRTSVSLTVEKRTGANIIEVANAVKEEVAHLETTLPPTAEVRILADQSVDIEEMVTTLENNILSGLLLVLIVLFVALGFRPAVIVSAAIPFSMLITFMVVSFLGYTLNMVILFSLVLVLGMLVDNAIVTVENIYRHREMGDEARHAAGLGASEVAMPIIASTATTLCAFAPMLFWPGIIGEFMKYLPITLIIGLSASLFVALVFNPTLAMVLFRKPVPVRDRAASPGRMVTRYRALLGWFLDAGPRVRGYFIRNWFLHGAVLLVLMVAAVARAVNAFSDPPLLPPVLPWAFFLAAAVLFALQAFLGTDRRALLMSGMGAVLILTFVAYGELGQGQEFFPEVEPREIWIDLEFPSGTNLEEQDRVVLDVESRTAETVDLTDRLANVASTGISLGPLAGGGGGDESRVSLQIARFHEREQDSFTTLAQVRDQVAGAYPGVRVVIDKPEEGPQTGKPVSVRLLGDDYALLGETAERVAERIEQVPGLLNVTDDFDGGYPEIRVVVDRSAAARAKTNTREVATTIRTALAGMEAAKYRVGEDEYDITVRLPAADRKSADRLEELTVLDDDGVPVPLRSLARFETSTGPAAIKRVDLRRAITVEADVDHAAGYRDPDLRAEVGRILEEEMNLPAGIRWEFAGSNEEEQDAKEFLSRAFLIALLLIGLILVTEFDSLVTPITIVVSVVLSLIGVLWGLIITQLPFGIIMTGIGVISLAGIVVNNAIVLCDFILQQRRAGKPRREAILEAGAVRFRPVLLTAVTTILGLIPLTTGINIDFINFQMVFGSESTQWWGPMGVAVIFGLGVATLLTLVVVPVTYDILDSLREKIGL